MTVIDVAGGPTGGAARFRQEAERWVANQADPLVRLVGIGEHVEPRWLIRRELICRRERRIAANNMSFLAGRGPRIVLLRNALHFLRPDEADHLPALSHAIRRQTPAIRAAVHRADVIVVPCSDMADRVTRILPRLAQRVMVRNHPLRVTRPRAAVGGDRGQAVPYILYPSIPSFHKDVVGGLRQLTTAIARDQIPLRVKVTCHRDDLGHLAERSLVDAVGVQSLAAMDALWAGASAAYSPYTVESFNYPVAESRAIGVPIVALDTSVNREIGASALMAFRADDPTSLSDALQQALASSLVPDPLPFEPDTYFEWLTTL